MPISNTGPIKFSDIQTEFGGSPPISISEYYKNAPSGYTSSVTDMVVIGQPINISKFKGKAAGSIIIYNYNVHSCGDNSYGQLGIGNTTQYITLQQVKGVNGSGFITDIVQVACGYYHSLFIKSDGKVYSCGYNNNGQLGLNNTTLYTTLQQVKGVNGSGFIINVVQIACGGYHSLFVKSDGTVYSCGYNNYGQLGIGATLTTKYTTLQQVKGVNGSGFITNIVQVSGGYYHSLFTKSDGTVYGCGYNDFGPLGLNNTTTKYATLQQVKGVNGSGFIINVVQVACSGNYSLFLKSDGTVYSCGSNSNGQLGLGNTTQYTKLQQVKGVNGSGFITDIVQVAGGYYHSLFIKSDGTAYSCGYNNYGQLGIGNTTQYTTIQQVLGVNGSGFITNIVQVAGGYYHSLFTKSDGTVYCCGLNTNGQLGIGNTTSPYLTLQQVLGVNGSGFITNIVQVACGNYHTYFLKVAQ